MPSACRVDTFTAVGRPSGGSDYCEVTINDTQVVGLARARSPRNGCTTATLEVTRRTYGLIDGHISGCSRVVTYVQWLAPGLTGLDF